MKVLVVVQSWIKIILTMSSILTIPTRLPWTPKTLFQYGQVINFISFIECLLNNTIFLKCHPRHLFHLFLVLSKQHVGRDSNLRPLDRRYTPLPLDQAFNCIKIKYCSQIHKTHSIRLNKRDLFKRLIHKIS